MKLSEIVKTNFKAMDLNFDENDYVFLDAIERPILLGFGGSISYGTNVPESDIDLRGIAGAPRKELLLGSFYMTNVLHEHPFEQIRDDKTDTTIYSLSKIFTLFINNNPTCVELLGLKPEHYVYMTPIGQKILENRHLFLSKNCIESFCGYAERKISDINKAAVGEDRKKDKRNDYAFTHNKIGKHCMHLLRTYLTGVDLVESGKIITYREKEHDLLMRVRNNEFIGEDGFPTKEFFDIVDEYKNRMKNAITTTPLPDRPDIDNITKLLCELSEELMSAYDD